MVRSFFAAFLVCLAAFAAPAFAQAAWVQVEAHPDLRTAQDRARAYGTAFSDVNGFRLRGGWYVLALGPYSEDQAQQRLLELRRGGLIPRDSYVSDSARYGDQFWPVGGTTQRVAPQTPAVTPEQPAVQEPVVELDETPREARRSESLLDRDARKQLQTALQWFGFYTAAIDGAFGRGTRNSMGKWQADQGYDVTGILTTKQRVVLLENYKEALAELGLENVVERTAGIEITMPAKLVTFDKYEYPFVQYKPKGDSGIQVLLISQAGDQTTMGGLYDIMQTLEIVPLEGERKLRRNSFTLTGQSDTLHSYSYARLEGGYLKGFSLVFPPEKADAMARVIEIMQDSLVVREGTLDPSQGDAAGQSVDLLAGLELRRPKASRSGFYVDGRGSVVTSAQAVASCERVTLDGIYEADVVASDQGLALLTPKVALVPLNFAQLSTGQARLRTDVAVAGYSYEGALDAPTLTYGTLEDVRGLDGDEGVQRLSVATLPGDVGGPVLEASGAVSGLLLPEPEGSRALPDRVAFAAKTSVLATFLSENGIDVSAQEEDTPIAPEDLVIAAADMTVLVGCW